MIYDLWLRGHDACDGFGKFPEVIQTFVDNLEHPLPIHLVVSVDGKVAEADSPSQRRSCFLRYQFFRRKNGKNISHGLWRRHGEVGNEVGADINRHLDGPLQIDAEDVLDVDVIDQLRQRRWPFSSIRFTHLASESSFLMMMSRSMDGGGETLEPGFEQGIQLRFEVLLPIQQAFGQGPEDAWFFRENDFARAENLPQQCSVHMGEVDQIHRPARSDCDFIDQQLSFATCQFFARIDRDINITVRPLAPVRSRAEDHDERQIRIVREEIQLLHRLGAREFHGVTIFGLKEGFNGG